MRSQTSRDCVQRQQRFGKAVGGLLIAVLIHQHGMAAALKQGALRGKDGVLAAGQPVMTVYQQNFQAAASLGVKATPHNSRLTA